MKRGDLVYDKHPDKLTKEGWTYKIRGPFKIMGEIDGYLMVRSPRAMPFVLYKKEALNEKGEPYVV